MDLIGRAEDLAGGQLAAPLPRRWRHVRAVAVKAHRTAALLEDADRPALVAAAWLHDVGYAPALVETGFHPLDGARWLRRIGFDRRVTALVAHHSCALLEAQERGLAAELDAEFENEATSTSDALWYVDFTTGPDGQDFDVEARLEEIRRRYGDGHVVTRFIDHAEPEILASVWRTDERLRAAGIVV